MAVSSDAASALQLPVPEQVRLHRFSLFEKTSTLDIPFGPGVFCLAGANGLGKSTFVIALNYAITGVVAEPGREFRGVEDYYRKVRAYSESFFRGRITPEDLEAAYVELILRVGQNRYRLRRGMLDPLELLEFEVTNAASGEVVVAHDPALEPGRRHALYVKMMVADCGLQSFAQLAFLQHFVLTFDERRELLFWDPRILPAALFIAFGVDPIKAGRADRLQEIVRGADSLARNYNWQASDWKRQLDNLEVAADEVVTEDDGVGRQHEAFQAELDEAVAEAQGLADELDAVKATIAEKSAQLRADRTDYDRLWTQRLRGHGHPSVHPVVTTSLNEHRCALCGTEGGHVAGHIDAQIKAGLCPLCSSPLRPDSVDSAPDLSDLAALDERIIRHQEALAAGEKAVADLTRRLGRARDRRAAIERTLAQFEEANELTLLRRRGDLDAVAERYRAAMADQLQRKQEQLRRRDEAQTELRALQRDLVGSYSVAEDTFVPDFTRLAKRFLGLSLDIELEARRNNVSLLLRVQGTERRGEDTLSESQRFFLDIALRMALVMQMSPPDAKGALYIDTPEGSLDIAYEARAGDMFGTFVRDGFGLIMTANINTSKLLERLAATCGRGLMTLERMTDWTVLSQVQADEEDLFDLAFAGIESALDQSSQ
jgi:DNA repair exonuclease SbcCD ATPase subunit